MTALGATETKRLSDFDRSELLKAYQEAQRSARPIPGGYSARSLSEGWQTRFDVRGFTVQPDTGGWTWGLELQRYGFAGSERPAGAASAMSAEKERVRYRRGELDEWFVNDTAGVEHGFTLAARPAGGSGPLRFVLGIRGNLTPRLSANGRDVVFQDEYGRSVLNYAGLKVWDARGKVLPARFEASAAGTLQLAVEEAGAQYPLTVDPWVKQAYLKGSNGVANSQFGSSLGISGDTVVVGAAYESNGTGCEILENSGAAYVFVRNGSTWTEQAYLKASNAGVGDAFGYSVAISGDTIVVGAAFEDSNATGVDGGDNDLAPNAGAAYVFVRSGTTWTQQAYLKAFNTGAQDYFGTSVAISGDTIVVGASGEGSSATGVNGDGGDNSLSNAGAAYVFVRQEEWVQQAYLKASNTGADYFGSPVDISGDTIVVGATSEASNATGINGNSADDSAGAAGAVYVFTRSGFTWSQQAYIKASNTRAGAVFGGSLAISGDTLIVGSSFESSGATGVNGNQSDTSQPESGSAYVFVRSGSTWSQQAYLKASNTGESDRFGISVDISGDRAIVGAIGESSNATGIDGNGSDNSAAGAGAAYVFSRTGTTWSQQAYVKASNTSAGAAFGYSVVISGDTVVIGSTGESSSSSTINGDETTGQSENSGAAYVYTLPGGTSDLTITKSHSGAFTQGEAGIYSISVTNAGTSATSGQVTVTDALPSGLIARQVIGTGWTCSLSTVSCFRSDALQPGQSYPSISVAVSVAGNAPLTGLTNVATVSGGGDSNPANNTASDFTSIVAPVVRPALSLTVSPSALLFEYAPGAPALIAKTVSVTGEPGIGFLAQSTANWLSVTPGAGATQGTLRVLPNPSGLAKGTYSAVVLITGPTGTPYAVDVTLRVLAPPELFAAPGALRFTYRLSDPTPSAQLYIGLRGGAVNLDYTAAPKDNWVVLLKASGTTGNLANPLIVSLNAAGLNPGKYETVLVITSPSALNSPLQVPVTLEVRQ